MKVKGPKKFHEFSMKTEAGLAGLEYSIKIPHDYWCNLPCADGICVRSAGRAVNLHVMFTIQPVQR